MSSVSVSVAAPSKLTALISDAVNSDSVTPLSESSFSGVLDASIPLDMPVDATTEVTAKELPAELPETSTSFSALAESAADILMTLQASREMDTSLQTNNLPAPSNQSETVNQSETANQSDEVLSADISDATDIDSDDVVTAYLRVKNLNDTEFINSHYVLFCTKKGVIKKTLLEQYSRPRQNGVNAITIREDDSVIEVRMTNGNNEIIIANRNGRAIRFHEAAVRVMGRTATGVRGITLDNDGQDEVVGMICIKDLETESVMVVSEQGYGKRSEIEDYRKTNRGGKGVKTMNITEKTGKLVTIKSVTDENDLMIINKSGITIRLKVADVRIMGRATQGVRLINLEKRNDQIGSVCKVMTESLEDEIPAEEAEGTIVSDPNADVPDIDDAADVNENESNNEIEE